MESHENPENASATTPDEDDIRSTDIVFDCPVCGHTLVIDYKGAGLHVPCPDCGNTVQAPIPEGMRISDLDLEPGELLRQLFATRRMLLKAESKIAEQEAQIRQLTDLTRDRESDDTQTAELLDSLQTLQASQNDLLVTLADTLRAKNRAQPGL